MRHIERTAVILHLIDAYDSDVAKAYKTIRNELKAYSEDLATRPEVIALTKIEGLDDDIIEMQKDALRKVAGDTPVFSISSQAHTGLTDVLRELRKEVVAIRVAEKEATQDENDGVAVISLNQEQVALAWTVKKVQEDDQTVFVVKGHKIEKFARRTNFETFEGINRLRDIMKKMGIGHALTRAGAEGNSIIRIGLDEFTLLEQ